MAYYRQIGKTRNKISPTFLCSPTTTFIRKVLWGEKNISHKGPRREHWILCKKPKAVFLKRKKIREVLLDINAIREHVFLTDPNLA